MILDALQGSVKIRVTDLKRNLIEDSKTCVRGELDELWELVNRIRRKDELICVIEEEYHGMFEPVWTMRAI